ncbi:DUF3040 domain-containing protein [Frigoribacterium sp. VKM Ac-2530]|uniref:DUF3040 domain-containing protein n=1 Tax=Frigoribacterium sp. VKM Ac-2530 TaxID=2783822 RepID=UPI001889D144|nr:DUF3040 domain-containing protein [Frigoribacterium sp. VKM Ac-2530]MBF4580124.1 DUF3040 domain-containing protein [Frigoribacterium sp. VKM Ac-2530]
MDIGSWGGGLVLALVAVLWLVYLVPTWQRRREYLATERNAVRLQQTLRILAQTAELPEEVRIEANARSVADAQRILAREETKREALRRAHEAARQRAVTRELAAAAPVLRAADHDPALAARRLRRSRLVSTVVLVLGAVAIVAGIATSFWVASIAGLAFGAGAVAMLAQLAAVSRARARRQVASAPRVGQPLRDFSSSLADPEAEVEVESREWTPVPVPTPLYLRRGRQRPASRPAATAAASAPAPESPADDLRRQSERSVQALRESQRAQHQALREAARAEAALSAPRAAPAPATPRAPAAQPAAASPPPPPAAPSRFARMGIVDDLGEPSFRLDEALERRRAV